MYSKKKHKNDNTLLDYILTSYNVYFIYLYTILIICFVFDFQGIPICFCSMLPDHKHNTKQIGSVCVRTQYTHGMDIRKLFL